jgi:hypothetical protein
MPGNGAKREVPDNAGAAGLSGNRGPSGNSEKSGQFGQSKAPLAKSTGGLAVSLPGSSEQLWAGSGAEQLAWLLAPTPVQGRLGAEWLRRSLKASNRSQDFMDRHREDPMLEINARCQGYLAKEALLLHPERLGDRLMALLAIRGRTWPGQEPIETFLRRCLHDAADQLCLEDAQDEAREVPGDPDLADDFALASELFGVEAPFQRLVLLRFNRLPRYQRRTLFAWIARGIEPGATNLNSTSARSTPPNPSLPGDPTPTAFPPATPSPRATGGKDPSEGPNSPDRLTLSEARRILAQVLALPEGRQS